MPLRAQIESDVVARVSVLSAGERRYSATSGIRDPTGEATGAASDCGQRGQVTLVTSPLQHGPLPGCAVGGGSEGRPAAVTPAHAVGSPIAHAHALKVQLKTAQSVKSADADRESRERRTKTATKMKMDATCCVIGIVWRRSAGKLAGWTLTGKDTLIRFLSGHGLRRSHGRTVPLQVPEERRVDMIVWIRLSEEQDFAVRLRRRLRCRRRYL